MVLSQLCESSPVCGWTAGSVVEQSGRTLRNCRGVAAVAGAHSCAGHSGGPARAGALEPLQALSCVLEGLPAVWRSLSLDRKELWEVCTLCFALGQYKARDCARCSRSHTVCPHVPASEEAFGNSQSEIAVINSMVSMLL